MRCVACRFPEALSPSAHAVKLNLSGSTLRRHYMTIPRMIYIILQKYLDAICSTRNQRGANFVRLVNLRAVEHYSFCAFRDVMVFLKPLGEVVALGIIWKALQSVGLKGLHRGGGLYCTPKKRGCPLSRRRRRSSACSAGAGVLRDYDTPIDEEACPNLLNEDGNLRHGMYVRLNSTVYIRMGNTFSLQNLT